LGPAELLAPTLEQMVELVEIPRSDHSTRRGVVEKDTARLLTTIQLSWGTMEMEERQPMDSSTYQGKPGLCHVLMVHFLA
jgi:hypothetical protein